ncbi:hypothetical protein BP5796_08821 [Coleophoma crateriformis]|uniref:Mso1 N-terminal domain-containing protein n=1 Tax=Coleophoma crateriformis TaxID=565419 RepID=A0A3D8R985_9HELO|nr:hypothetical protein BP5796_08821 [Coleophoma crateriformis]
MTSYLSSLLTTTTSRVASIRQNLLASEDDGPTEDDTHLCRVLRAYYTEKGRQFPAWLPPDPKAPAPVAAAPVMSQSSIGSRYGGANMQAVPGGAAAGPGSGLSSLWNKSEAGVPNAGGGSLRAGRAQAAAAGGLSPYQREAVQARPLPSQREGSYQSASPFAGRDSPAAGSASNRLKDRFRSGARSASPASGMSGPRGGSYDTASSGAYDSSYEDSFMPRDSGAGGGGGYSAPPRVAAGLPSGPRAGRGPGLPSGPRGMR